MTKHNIVVCCYDKILVNVATYVMFTPDQRTTHTPNQELHIRPYLPRFYQNNTLQYCIL